MTYSIVPPTSVYSHRHANCIECGAKMNPTGNCGTARSSRPAFNSCYVAPPMRIVEYECESCGQEEWAEAGVVEDVAEGV
jgi:hypothetical protein